MLKVIIPILSLICESVFAQSNILTHENIFPYRNHNGDLGYVDENLKIKIAPQYKNAQLFNVHGYAVVTDGLNRKGVINKNNHYILSPKRSDIFLHALAHFTLAEVYEAFNSDARLWDWKFLPGLNLLGGGSNDKRLFDTHVKRIKKSVLILGEKNKKILSTRMSASEYSHNKYNIQLLSDDRVIIDRDLYQIDKKGAHLIAKGIKDPLTENTYSKIKNKDLQVICTNEKGEITSETEYKQLDSLVFKAIDIPLFIPLGIDAYSRVAEAYTDRRGKVFLYPDFTKPLPRLIDENVPVEDLSAETVLKSATLIAPVPNADCFIVMTRNGEHEAFYFLDTLGKWHLDLPPNGSFKLTTRSGNIVWPLHAHYISAKEIPMHFKIQSIHQVGDSQLYKITLGNNKEIKQGIWHFWEKRWLLPPEYYQVLSLGNNRGLWRFQADKKGLWGIMDSRRNILVKPTYYSIDSNGHVLQLENGEYTSFFLHLPTLRELREK